MQKDYWHQGFAIEAAQACKRYAFETLKASNVYSIVRDLNIASMNVSVRNGMTVKKRVIKHYYGIEMPHYLFSVRNPNNREKSLFQHVVKSIWQKRRLFFYLKIFNRQLCSIFTIKFI